jgi:glycosyltransferase involved in cell wall biosynthesis
MRISWISNSAWSCTGYGQQLKIVVPRLKALGHEQSIQAFYGHQGSPIDWNGVTVYGAHGHAFGMDTVAAHADNFRADCVISNMDAWVVEPAMMLNQKWVAWFPIDSEPCPPLVIEKVKQAFHRVVWTEFGKREMDKVGLDYDYIPYGVDLNVFKPGDRVLARETAHMPQDKFIVGMVAMNKGYPPRKAFYQNIEAFKRLHDKHPDTMLYLHTLDGSHPNGETIDLRGFAEGIGLKIGTDVIFADQYSYLIGYPDTAMATLYNCFDVHLLVSMGEGFGMPQLEAQACGTPVICGDWTSMPELCFSGWKVDRKDAEPTYTTQNTYQFTPHVNAIVDKLEQAYQMRGNADYAKRAVDGAKKYSIDRVIEKYWLPVLAKIDAKIKATPRDKNLADNLAVLR